MHDALIVRSLADVTDLIVHHSAGALSQTALDIDAEHRAEGWVMIGYHYVILPSGEIDAGRPIDTIPAAAYGRNAQSIDVCLIGNFEPGSTGYTGSPTEQQLKALETLALWLHMKVTTINCTIGHRDVATLYYPTDTGPYATACPGDTLETRLSELKAYVAQYLPKH